jgi:signal peptidase II
MRAGWAQPATLGWATLGATFAADQASKLGLLYLAELPLREPIRLGPFVDLIVVWNRGVSYGMLQQSTELGRWLLTVGSILAAVGLAVWIARAGNRLLSLSLGLIAGGALGNAVDRMLHGAVFDFVHFHVGDFSWYVFNVADAAIVAGVVGLIYDSLFNSGAETVSRSHESQEKR